LIAAADPAYKRRKSYKTFTAKDAKDAKENPGKKIVKGGHIACQS
jgi:hypothetical protein